MNRFMSLTIKILEMLRPKFYNRLTWVIVIAGLSLMTTPVWTLLLSEFIEKSFEFSITGESDLAWGFLLCVTGLIYHLAITGMHEFLIAQNTKEKNQKIQEHDGALFMKLTNLLPEEYLNSLIDYIETEDALRWDDHRKIESFILLANEAGHSFITLKLKISTEKLTSALSEFIIFTSRNFDEYPYGQGVINFKMCLAPQLNCDRAGNWEDGPKYNSLVQEMMSFTQDIRTSYKEWRTTVKDTLYI
ncbi:hypothetical protein K1Y77_05225 [Halomonas qaidamensis]|uniref:Uncharacterized protein n=1 Tax=Halomonas qaidamensis TaxID=2866211 RepID=A0ABY6JST8_9GAMM|nr:hypothetical protein [Halomonas qaidamensis]UYV20066.1 hypothetical protein K1Y77_05225 [Halomonas qaidamensis]